jgi:hypothetical protein
MTPQLDAVDDTGGEKGGRVYRWSDGYELPSVTSILDVDPEKADVIKKFYERHPNPEQYRDEQGFLGQIIHHRILNRIALKRLRPPKLDMDMMYEGINTDIETIEAMWDDARDEYGVLDPGGAPRVERPVRNVECGYAGRFDLLTESGVLVDLKVSKAPYDSYFKQLAAYREAIKTTNLQTPHTAAIVALHPHVENNPSLKPQVNVAGESELEDWFEKFLAVKKVYDRT